MVGEAINFEYQRHKEKLAADQLQQVESRLSEFISQGARSITVLNSGAIIATLGLMQALVGKDAGIFSAIKCFGVTALILFLIGTVAGAIVFVWRYAELHAEFFLIREHAPFRRAVWASIAIALVCFCAGVATLIVGVALRL